jgi:transcriptional regulator GlxA family with amidase domain
VQPDLVEHPAKIHEAADLGVRAAKTGDFGHGAGWNAAIRDRQIRHVLTLMHGDLAHPWTLEELAQRAALSRTALAERFRSALGDTPLSHLRTLRMQKAMQLLSETRHTLEHVAQAVGYQDAFGFSKVFKRTTGMAPRAFREQDAHDRQQPWRLQKA